MVSSTNQREYYKTRAKLYDHLDLFNEMAQAMKNMINVDTNARLSDEERNMLSIAYKNSVDPNRSSYRHLRILKSDPPDDITLKVVEELIKYQEEQIASKCDDLLEVVKSLLVNDQISDESRVIYCKMVGDFQRYKAELNTPEREVSIKEAKEAYERASSLAEASLPPKNVARLGNALNYSVFNYEICENANVAIEMAERVISDAEACETEEESSDMAVMMKQLADNIAMWRADLDEEVER